MRAWGVIALVLCGCSESVDEVISKHRAGVEKTFASLRAVQLPEGRPAPVATTQQLRLEGGDITNAAFIYREDLKDPAALPPVPLRSLDALPLLQCARLLKDGKLVDSPFDPKPSVVKQYLEACARVRYAFVIQTIEYTAPLPPPPQSTKFTPGSYTARVFVIDLTDGAVLGGYDFAVGNSPDVKVAEGGEMLTHLVANLEGKAFNALRASTLRALPGSLKR